MPTILGLAVLPLTILWALQPNRLLELALICEIFEAGAAVVFGGFGLPVALLPGLTFVAYTALQYALGMRFPGEGTAFRILAPLMALLCYALFSVFFFPVWFAGEVMVSPQRPDPLGPELVPLAFNFGNVTQTLYLVMNATTALCAAVFLTRARVNYRRIISAYLLGGYLAVGFAFWDFAAKIAHVPFPDWLLYSNPSYAVVDQRFGAVPRVQGTFTEPAGLAFYLAGLCFACLWLTARGYRLMRVNVLLGLAILAMLLSTSTTGIVVLAVGLPLIVAFTILRGDARSLFRLAKTSAVMLLAGAFLIAPVLILQPKLLDAVGDVVQATLTKGDSESAEQRGALDRAGLATLGPTWGLGVGWGGFRTSSLIPGLIANGGVFAVFAMLWIGRRLTVYVMRAKRAARHHEGHVLIDGFTAALCGQIAAAILSSPSIGSLAFFLELGCIAGTTARILFETDRVRPRRRLPSRPTLAITSRQTWRTS